MNFLSARTRCCSQRSKLVNQIVGGWQVSMLDAFRTGLPTTISYGGLYPTNYLTSALAIVKPGAPTPETGVGYDSERCAQHLPLHHALPAATSSSIRVGPGLAASYAWLRSRTSISQLPRRFALPLEGHRLQFRAEAFNAFNNVNFYNPNLACRAPRPSASSRMLQPARVMQFALARTNSRMVQS